MRLGGGAPCGDPKTQGWRQPVPLLHLKPRIRSCFSDDTHQKRRADLRPPFPDPREAGHGAEGGMGPLLPRESLLEQEQPLRVSPLLLLPLRPRRYWDQSHLSRVRARVRA